MDASMKNHIPYEQIDNGALVLALLREAKTWEVLCGRYAFAEPANLTSNSNSMALRDKLLGMRDLGLIDFADEETAGGKKPVGVIKETDLWTKIRASFGGISTSEVAMISRVSKGMAVVPVFGRPQASEEKADIFVLMPFHSKMGDFYTNHIRRMGEELKLKVRRADDSVAAGPFMEKVWNGICSARLIIADCTEKNPNVFYEIGMAHTVGKKVVLITRSEKDIPSDIKHYDYIPYVYDPEGVGQLIEKLKAFIEANLRS